MNGEIGVKTEDLHGSTFWFTAELPTAAEIDPVQPTPALSLRGSMSWSWTTTPRTGR